MNRKQRLSQLQSSLTTDVVPFNSPLTSKSLSTWRRTLQLAAYVLACVLPTLLIGAGVAAIRFVNFQVSQPPAYSEAAPPVKAHDPGKRTVVIIAGNLGTENTDFLAPYAILAASDLFNVYVVAPERKVSPLASMPAMSESIDIMPDFSYADYEKFIGRDPDLIVIPFIPNLDTPEDRPIIDWIRSHAGPQTTLLSICAGALTLAETGLLNGHSATIHHGSYAMARSRYPAVNWVQGVRYVDNGHYHHEHLLEVFVMVMPC
jgi:AraC family transcriptional regulator, transcriptional activator FtrA